MASRPYGGSLVVGDLRLEAAPLWLQSQGQHASNRYIASPLSLQRGEVAKAVPPRAPITLYIDHSTRSTSRSACCVNSVG